MAGGGNSHARAALQAGVARLALCNACNALCNACRALAQVAIVGCNAFNALCNARRPSATWQESATQREQIAVERGQLLQARSPRRPALQGAV